MERKGRVGKVGNDSPSSVEGPAKTRGPRSLFLEKLRSKGRRDEWRDVEEKGDQFKNVWVSSQDE